jgi:hypothetical protein
MTNNNLNPQTNTDEQLISISEDTNLMKALALMQYNGEDFFIIDGKAYEGTEEDARKQAHIELEEGEEIDFIIWCENNLSEVEPTDDDGEKDNYMVLTDDEANEKTAEYIKDSLWAFNASFIIENSKLPYEAKEMIESFQREKCESANDTIEALIEDMDEFIEAAISADGRGHFINSYDGNEDEERISLHGINESINQTFYIYRIN